MRDVDGLEHDSLEDEPGAPAPRAFEEGRPPGEAQLRREDAKEEYSLTEGPWCSVDNPAIWQSLTGELDEG